MSIFHLLEHEYKTGSPSSLNLAIKVHVVSRVSIRESPEENASKKLIYTDQMTHGFYLIITSGLV